MQAQKQNIQIFQKYFFLFLICLFFIGNIHRFILWLRINQIFTINIDDESSAFNKQKSKNLDQSNGAKYIVTKNVQFQFDFRIYNQIKEMIEERKQSDTMNKITSIAVIPQNVQVYDMCFDWTGTKLAVACSDKTIRIFEKKSDETWNDYPSIKTGGPAVWKVKWARPQFGVFLLSCSRDSELSIHQLKKKQWSENKKNEWTSMIIRKQTTKCIEDVKFIPGKQDGLTVACVTTNDGMLKIFTVVIDQKKYGHCQERAKIQISELGLNCLSWSKDLMKNYMVIAVGCKSLQTTPKRSFLGMKTDSDSNPFKLEPSNHTIAFVLYKNKQLEKIKSPIQQSKAINDISWAFMNGRSYGILGVSSDGGMKIYEIRIGENSQSIQIQVLQTINLVEERQCLRLTFNVMGTMVAVGQRKRVRMFKAFERSSWGEITKIEDTEKS